MSTAARPPLSRYQHIIAACGLIVALAIAWNAFNHSEPSLLVVVGDEGLERIEDFQTRDSVPIIAKKLEWSNRQLDLLLLLDERVLFDVGEYAIGNERIRRDADRVFDATVAFLTSITKSFDEDELRTTVSIFGRSDGANPLSDDVCEGYNRERLLNTPVGTYREGYRIDNLVAFDGVSNRTFSFKVGDSITNEDLAALRAHTMRSLYVSAKSQSDFNFPVSVRLLIDTVCHADPAFRSAILRIKAERISVLP